VATIAVRPKAANTACAKAPLVQPKADATPPLFPEAIELAVMNIRSGPGVITNTKTVGINSNNVFVSMNIKKTPQEFKLRCPTTNITCLASSFWAGKFR
jgi:hypothetical protein